VEVCYKKTVAFVPIADIKARGLKPVKGFPGEYTQDNSRIQEAVSGRRAFGAEAVLDPARREKEVQSPDPPREKENQADHEIQIQHHPGSPLRHKQEERSWPDYGPGMAIRRNQMPTR
jgi:hypothetical protein